MLSVVPVLDFRIVDETDDYVVVDKPPFLLVHPTKPNGPRTLWKELRELLAFEIASGGQVSIVNRLDRETSGLILVAKTTRAARRFGLLMQRHLIKKEYLAIVWGWPEWDEKFVDAPMDRQSKHQKSTIWLKQMIHPEGAPAQTEFRVETRFVRSAPAAEPSSVAPSRSGTSRHPLPEGEDQGEGGSETPERFALVRAIPHTGRTHQIRVHLSSLGYPIVGDKIYGPDETLYLAFIKTGWTPELEHRLLLPRHALHSAKLEIKGETQWSSSLPLDLANFISARPTVGEQGQSCG